jgi:hypothetical protein
LPQVLGQLPKIDAEHVSVTPVLDHPATLSEAIVETVTVTGDQVLRTLVGTLRREWLDFLIPLTQRQLLGILN